MSEELQLDQVVEAVKEHTEGFIKEDALEGLAKSADIPSVEGFVKEETVAELREELKAEREAREELKGIIQSAPAIIKGETPMESWKWDNSGFNAKADIDLTECITKQYVTTTQVTGEPTSTMRLYFALAQTNPFRPYSTVMPMNSSTMELPVITSISAAHEPSTVEPTLSAAGGNLDTVELVTRNFVSRNFFSDQAVDDLPGLDSMVGDFAGQEIGVAEATDMVAQIKSAVNAVGFANRLTTTGGAISLANLIDMRQGLSSRYAMNGKYMMSRPIYSELRTLSQSGSGSDLVWDPVSGNMTLFGHEVIINDHLEDFGSANNLLALFGDFARSTVIGNRKSMTMQRNDQTIPGGVYYYGNMRSRGQLWDANGIFALRSNA